jgi:hypothetical protein
VHGIRANLPVRNAPPSEPPTQRNARAGFTNEKLDKVIEAGGGIERLVQSGMAL